LTTNATFASGINLQINEGTLQTAANSPFGNSFIVNIAAGATWDDSHGNGENFGGLSGAGTYLARAGAGVTIGGTSVNASFSGKITAGLNGVVGATAADRAFPAFNKTGTGTVTLTGMASDFQSRVHVQAGTLSINNLAHRGLPSALGLGSTGSNADITIGTATQTATLQYTGPSSTTNRRVEVQHAGSTVEVTNAASTLTVGVVTGANSTAGLTKTGAGTLLLNDDAAYTGATTVNAGKLALGRSLTTSSALNASGGTIELLVGGDKLMKTAGVSFSGAGKIDLKDNKMIVTGQAAGDIVAHVAAGRIDTTMPAATSGNPLTTLAVASNADLGRATFAGASVSPTDVLIMYTYAGDANLSGLIDADDYFQIDMNYNKPGAAAAGHYAGDFDYSGQIDGDDFFLIDANYNSQGAPISAAAPLGGISAVPEPSAVTMIGIAAAMTLIRRRRHS
jgi:autotransporter-associated beta strand protein